MYWDLKKREISNQIAHNYFVFRDVPAGATHAVWVRDGPEGGEGLG